MTAQPEGEAGEFLRAGRDRGAIVMRGRCDRCGRELQAGEGSGVGPLACPGCGAEVPGPPVPLASPVVPSPSTVREAWRSVANRLDRGLPLRPVKERLGEEGFDEATAAAVVADGIAAYRRAAWRNVLLGVLVLAAGMALTVGISLALIVLNGRYVITTGLLLGGAGLVCRGVYQLYRAATASVEPKQRTRYL
jgi:hypothetical protein